MALQLASNFTARSVRDDALESESRAAKCESRRRRLETTPWRPESTHQVSEVKCRQEARGVWRVPRHHPRQVLPGFARQVARRVPPARPPQGCIGFKPAPPLEDAAFPVAQSSPPCLHPTARHARSFTRSSSRHACPLHSTARAVQGTGPPRNTRPAQFQFQAPHPFQFQFQDPHVMGAGPFKWKMEKNADSTKTLLLHSSDPTAAGQTNFHFE